MTTDLRELARLAREEEAEQLVSTNGALAGVMSILITKGICTQAELAESVQKHRQMILDEAFPSAKTEEGE
jgi:hypothetical protein